MPKKEKPKRDVTDEDLGPEFAHVVELMREHGISSITLVDPRPRSGETGDVMLVGDTGIEIDIHVQAVTRIGLHRLDNALQDFIPFGFAHFFAQLTHAFAHVTRARVLGAIDAVAKAGDGLARFALGFDVIGGFVRRADFFDHFHHVLGCTAMRGAR